MSCRRVVAAGLALALAACSQTDGPAPADGSAAPSPPASASERPGGLPPGRALPPPGVAAQDPAAATALIRPLETWGGSQSAVELQSSMRAATNEEWQALWRLAGTVPPRPLAEGREVATGVFLGQRPTGGYGVEIVGLQPRLGEPGGALVWRETPPPEGALLSQAMTMPWQIATFPADAIPAGFGEVR